MCVLNWLRMRQGKEDMSDLKKEIALNFSYLVECGFEIESQKLDVSVF